MTLEQLVILIKEKIPKSYFAVTHHIDCFSNGIVETKYDLYSMVSNKIYSYASLEDLYNDFNLNLYPKYYLNNEKESN